MVKILRQYVKIIGYSLTGIAFGFAFFYLFLNIYHYSEIRREVYFDFSSDTAISQLSQTLSNVEKNLQAFQPNNYHGTLDYSDADLWRTRLQICVQSFRNDTYQKILSKEKLNIQDVEDLREVFTSQVLNNCVVTHLYSLIGEDTVNSRFIRENQKLLQYYMDDLLQDTSYLKKDLYANSNYFFTTDIVTLTVKNDVKDGFYEVISAYTRAAKFLELISDWYASEVGGAV